MKSNVEIAHELLNANPDRKFIFTIPDTYEAHCKKYFLSVKPKFHQTLRRKILISIIQLTAFLLLFGGFFGSFTLVKPLQETTNIGSGIWISLIFIISFIIGAKVIPFLNGMEARLLKGFLSDESIRFCRLQIAIDNLQSYTTNDLSDHLKIAYKQVQEYFDEEPNIQINLGKETGKSNEMPAYAIIRTLNNTSWFKLDEEVQMTCTAFENIPKILLPNIAKGTNINQIIKILNNLKGYTYGNIGKQNSETLTINGPGNKITTKEYGELLLLVFAEEMKHLVFYSANINAEARTKPFFKSVRNFFTILNEYFQHTNIFISLFSWMILFGVIVTIALYVAINILGKSDLSSQGLATSVVGVLGGAIAMTVKLRK